MMHNVLMNILMFLTVPNFSIKGWTVGLNPVDQSEMASLCHQQFEGMSLLIVLVPQFTGLLFKGANTTPLSPF